MKYDINLKRGVVTFRDTPRGGHGLHHILCAPETWKRDSLRLWWYRENEAILVSLELMARDELLYRGLR